MLTHGSSYNYTPFYNGTSASNRTQVMNDYVPVYQGTVYGNAYGDMGHNGVKNVDITGIPMGEEARSYGMGGFGYHQADDLYNDWKRDNYIAYQNHMVQHNQWAEQTIQPLIDQGFDSINNVAQNTFQQVTNTGYYNSDAYNQYFDYWGSRASVLGSSSSSYGNLGYTLDSVVPGISNWMDQSTGPLAGYSATGSSLNSLLSSIGVGF